MTWEDIQALACDDFIAWLDENHREAVTTALLRRHRHLADVDASEAWGMLLLYAWHGKNTAERFNDADHVRPWCVSRMWGMLRFMWTNERQRRGFKGCKHRATEVLLSELEQEHRASVMVEASERVERKTISLSPSGDGWLSVLLDDLTDRQRSAVEMLVIAERTGLEAMELEPGCKRPQDFYASKRDGLNACRRAFKRHTFEDATGQRFSINEHGDFIYDQEAA